MVIHLSEPGVSGQGVPGTMLKGYSQGRMNTNLLENNDKIANFENGIIYKSNCSTRSDSGCNNGAIYHKSTHHRV